MVASQIKTSKAPQATEQCPRYPSQLTVAQVQALPQGGARTQHCTFTGLFFLPKMGSGAGTNFTEWGEGTRKKVCRAPPLFWPYDYN